MEPAEDLFFGDLLQRLRHRQGLTQQRLTELIGVSRNTLGFWERGYYRPESVTLLHELAHVLQLDEEEKRLLFEAYHGCKTR